MASSQDVSPEWEANPRRRVLSIQSHVVHGYVGNKAAVFPLQLLGFDVDVINSVHFSNHTGYPKAFEGDVMNGKQLVNILNGLERNQLLYNVGHILTGYIGSESFLRSVIQVIHTVRNTKPPSNISTNNNDGHSDRNQHHTTAVRYICDPVLGDSGKFYVPLELVNIYREDVIPLANVVTPNHFEVEQLTGITIHTIQDAIHACRALHDMGPELVIITSVLLPTKVEGEGTNQSITIIASQRKKRNSKEMTLDEDGKTSFDTNDDEIWSIQSPLIRGTFTGTGDLCAALILGWTAKEPSNLKSVIEKVISTMFTVIKFTHERYLQDANRNQLQERSTDSDNFNHSVALRELRLIQSKDIIENPPDLFTASRIVDFKISLNSPI